MKRTIHDFNFYDLKITLMDRSERLNFINNDMVLQRAVQQFELFVQFFNQASPAIFNTNVMKAVGLITNNV
jgi:hypothetical protein